MKKVFVLMTAAIMVTAFVSCGGGAKGLKTEQDSVAYALGIDLGMNLKTMDSTLNVDVIARAIKDVMANKAVMSRDTAYKFLEEYFMVRKPAKEKAEAKAFLEEVAKQKDVQKTETGLLYQVLEPGTDKVMNQTDTVVVNYKGTYSTGEVFDSSYDAGKPATFVVNQVIPGWTEGIMLVGKGGKIKLWIPAELAYAFRGNNRAMIFEIELIDIKPNTNPEAAKAPETPATPAK